MKIIVYSGPGIGDIILTLPVIKALKESNPLFMVDIVVNASSERVRLIKELLSFQEYVQDIYYYNSKDFLHDVKTLYILRSKHYDYAIMCRHLVKDLSGVANKIMKLAGCRTVGIYNKVCHLKYDYEFEIYEGTHVAESFCQMLQLFGIHPSVNINTLNVKKIQNVTLPSPNDICRDYIVFCIGTGIMTCKTKWGRCKKLPSKDWKLSNWIELAESSARDGENVVLIGKIEFGNALLHLKKIKGVYNYINKTSIAESLKIILESKIVVGADTGLMHCAAALNKPTISLFGVTDPVEYVPYGNLHRIISQGAECLCAPCFGTDRAMECRKSKCMDEITVNNVLLEIRLLLQQLETA